MPEPMQWSFLAKYDGPCARGDQVAAGDRVTYEEGQIVHVECHRDEPKPTKFQGSTLDEMGY